MHIAKGARARATESVNKRHTMRRERGCMKLTQTPSNPPHDCQANKFLWIEHECLRQTSLVQTRSVLNMDTNETTLCAKSESALKKPRDLIWLASRSPLLIDMGGKQD